jgi:hypothetical protein
VGDLRVFAGCTGGPAVEAGSGCSCMDVDGDGDVDLGEYALLQRAQAP